MIARKGWSWRHTFPKQWQVELDNLPIESKYRLKMFPNDVPRQAGDDHDFYVLFVGPIRIRIRVSEVDLFIIRQGVHFDVFIAEGVWRSRATTGGHGG